MPCVRGYRRRRRRRRRRRQCQAQGKVLGRIDRIFYSGPFPVCGVRTHYPRCTTFDLLTSSPRNQTPRVPDKQSPVHGLNEQTPSPVPSKKKGYNTHHSKASQNPKESQRIPETPKPFQDDLNRIESKIENQEEVRHYITSVSIPRPRPTPTSPLGPGPCSTPSPSSSPGPKVGGEHFRVSGGRGFERLRVQDPEI